MSDTTINHPELPTPGMKQHKSSADAASKPASGIVPTRRGSKYADILLQRLRAETIDPTKPAIIGLASASPRQGVTTTAMNLAIRAADHGVGKVLIIDANHRNQRASRMYRATGDGVSECLTGHAALDACVHPTRFKGLSLLGLGKAKLAQQIVMGGAAAEDFFEAVRASYQLTVVDLPVMNEPCIANAFLPNLDGVLMVGQYGMKKDQMIDFQEAVRTNGGNVIGTVMTGKESKLPNWISRWF